MVQKNKLYQSVEKSKNKRINRIDALNIFATSKSVNYFLVDMKDAEIRLWDEFPEYDPFQYVLDYIRPDLLGNLVWQKTFFKRNTNEQSKIVNILKPYVPEHISKILKDNSFSSLEIYSGWSKDLSNDTYIILPQK